MDNNVRMASTRSKLFWRFQLLFWMVAGLALFISGLTQTGFFAALIRNLFLFVAGFLSSFFFSSLIDRLNNEDELRLRLISFSLVYVVAMLCVIAVNFISFSLIGQGWQELSWGQWFSGTMNFALVYWFWTELFIQKVYLKGGSGIHPEEQRSAGQDHLVVTDRGTRARISLSDIRAVTAAGDYVEIHLPDRNLLDRRTIQSLEERLAPAGFTRVHRSTIINPDHVMRLTPLGKGRFELQLDSGLTINSSRSYENRVRQVVLPIPVDGQ